MRPFSLQCCSRWPCTRLCAGAGDEAQPDGERRARRSRVRRVVRESEGTRSDFIWASWFCLFCDLPLGRWK